MSEDTVTVPASMARLFQFDETYRKALREPFPNDLIGHLPKGGAQLDFVGHAAVTDRLNKVAPDWSYTIDRIEMANGHVTGILGTMRIGGKAIPEAGAVDRASSFGEEMKLAISDFIRRGAMRFGVALDLWSKEDLGADKLPIDEPDADTGVDSVGPGEGGHRPDEPALAPSPWDLYQSIVNEFQGTQVELRQEIRRYLMEQPGLSLPWPPQESWPEEHLLAVAKRLRSRAA